MKIQFSILILVILAAQSGLAQSGRNKQPLPSPSPSPAEQLTTPTVTPPSNQPPLTQTSPKPAQVNPSPMPTPPTPNFHPNAFIIGGRAIVTGGKSYGGDDVGDVMNQIKFMFDLEHAPAKIGKGGKLTRTQAIARAKQESDSYVLYMEIQET